MQANESRAMAAELAGRLDQLDAGGLRRFLRALPRAGGRLPAPDGATLLNFSSNDYLDLAGDPRLVRAAQQALEQSGCGAGASRLMSGHLDLHEETEAALAELAGGETALIFGSGFLTNYGVLTSLAGAEDEILADKLNHASLIDGMRASGAAWRRYRHNDPDHLETLLRREPPRGRRLIVTDSVFSMDGDLAPLEAIARLAREYGAALIVDEAHAVGVFGNPAGGCCHALPEELRPDVIVGTMSKSLGSYGGFAICAQEIRDWLINRARSFIYSTGLPPASLAAAREAIRILRSEPQLGPELLRRVDYLYRSLDERGVPVDKPASQILPVRIGENAAALRVAERLQQAGMLATAVRPPTVPAGTARLRLSVTLAHREEDLDRLAEEVAGATVEAAP